MLCLEERELTAYLIESKKNGLITQSMMSDDMPGRTNSNFDTHMMLHQREKYLDKLGIDGGAG